MACRESVIYFHTHTNLITGNDCSGDQYGNDAIVGLPWSDLTCALLNGPVTGIRVWGMPNWPGDGWTRGCVVEEWMGWLLFKLEVIWSHIYCNMFKERHGACISISGLNYYFRLQLRYGKRWGPVHPDQQPMSDDRLMVNYSFAEGEYITSMSMFAGVGLDGFTMETNVREYDHILGNGGNQMPPATGQRMLFISGELHWYINWQQVTRVRLYFDTC